MRGFIVLLILLPLFSSAQQDSIYATDSAAIPVKELAPVTVTAYSQQRSLQETPAAVNIISGKDLNLVGNNSILPALNATPGVHMEERSPGSYRLSIRGSSLRSPFGVRNVKVYYNDIPITDPGGFTYLNLLGFYNVADVQVIKGPGSSLYGAGNGGVLLINSGRDSSENMAGVTGGSYGMRAAMAKINLGHHKLKQTLSYEYQAADGYRSHSASDRQVVSYDAVLHCSAKTDLSAHFLYNHLYYETPGALTLNEYDQNPRSARPDAGAAPGAITQHAAIYQDDALLGFTLHHRFDTMLSNTTTVYGLYSRFNNPTIRNYSRTIDPHFGLRTAFHYDRAVGSSMIKIAGGVEAQKSISLVRTYTNVHGDADSLLSDNKINASNLLAFLQATVQYKKLVVEAGASLSNYNTSIEPRSAVPATLYKTSVFPFSPRIAILYRFTNTMSAYINTARGYSTPTIDELAPSGGAINSQLHSEYGWNYEAGIRGTLFSGKLFYDASMFYYTLTNAIVVRKDNLGGDYYINAGSTDQKGLEAQVKYHLFKSTAFITSADINAGVTIYDFHYKEFQEAENNYSGNKLPGVAPQTVTARLDVYMQHGFSMSLNYYYSAQIALNDANAVYASPYHLLGAKIMYAPKLKLFGPEIFLGADNILNQTYSLGNDINAAGGRYYNAAPCFNMYAGLVMHF